MAEEKQQRENYFQSNVKRYGENFIHTKSAKMIQFDAKRRLFKEMVYGNIDYDQYGSYYTDPQFLDNLIAIASTLQNEHAVTAVALSEYSAQHGGNSIAEQLKIRHANVAKVFECIGANLIAIKQNGYNIQYLMYIVPYASAFRNDFSEFY